MKSRSSLGLLAPLALSAVAGAGKRLNVRVSGGNWQGSQYLSYAEHDRCVRATFRAPNRLARLARYQVEKGSEIASR
jgi:hypothetical protein